MKINTRLSKNNTNPRLYISDNSIELLKYIAIFIMIIDHFSFIFFEKFTFLNIIGRIAYPLFVLTIVYNYSFNSKDKHKYILRLLLFAIISEPFTCFAFNDIFVDYMLSIFVTLFLGTSSIYILENFKDFKRDILIFIYAIFIIFISPFVNYGLSGVVIIVAAYYFINNMRLLTFVPVLISLLLLNQSSDLFIRFGALLSIPLIYLVIRYDFIQIKRANKYFYYLFYPIHLLILKVAKIFFG